MPKKKSSKSSGITPLSIKVGDLLTGAYKGTRLDDNARMTQSDLARRSGTSVTTLNKKLAGKAPITVTDLVKFAAAIPDTRAGDILEAAIEALGGYEAFMSGASATNVVELSSRRSADELDQYTGDRAAHEFDEGADVPDQE